MMIRYRIGQTRDVIVYRLVTCGTVEEKMYARQIWKECVNKQVIEKKSTMKHFTKDELKDKEKALKDELKELEKAAKDAEATPAPTEEPAETEAPEEDATEEPAETAKSDD